MSKIVHKSITISLTKETIIKENYHLRKIKGKEMQMERIIKQQKYVCSIAHHSFKTKNSYKNKICTI